MQNCNKRNSKTKGRMTMKIGTDVKDIGLHNRGDWFLISIFNRAAESVGARERRS